MMLNLGPIPHNNFKSQILLKPFAYGGSLLSPLIRLDICVLQKNSDLTFVSMELVELRRLTGNAEGSPYFQ